MFKSTCFVALLTVLWTLTHGRTLALEFSLFVLAGVALLLGLHDPDAFGMPAGRTVTILGAGCLWAAVATGRIASRTAPLAIGAGIGVAQSVALLAWALAELDLAR